MNTFRTNAGSSGMVLNYLGVDLLEAAGPNVVGFGLKLARTLWTNVEMAEKMVSPRKEAPGSNKPQRPPLDEERVDLFKGMVRRVLKKSTVLKLFIKLLILFYCEHTFLYAFQKRFASSLGMRITRGSTRQQGRASIKPAATTSGSLKNLTV